MTCLEFLKNVVTVLLSILFIHSLVLNVIKYKEKKTVMSQSVLSIYDVPYPSITLCPMYDYAYARSITSGTKNLTEYYESLQLMSLIKKDIISISYDRLLKNG